MNEMYQVFDVFTVPSLFDAVPLVGVEAQLADLPCFFSDKVPTEVKFNNKSKFIRKDDGAKAWAKAILAVRNQTCTIDKEEIKNSHYDNSIANKILEDYYEKLFKDNKNEK